MKEVRHLRSIRTMLLFAIGALAVFWLGTTTWFRVAEHEEALVLTMGRATRQVDKGVHGKLPYPFETVEVMPVRLTRQLTFGYREQDGRTTLVQDEALMITGDENLVWADLMVEYKIADIMKYRFHSQNPEAILRNATSSALRSVIGTTTLDVAITTGKFEVQAAVEAELKRLMEIYDIGLRVEQVKLQDVEPPDQVQAEFKAVTDARESRATKINEAEKYRNERMPKARGEAQQLIERAQSTKSMRVNQAQGDVAKYKAVLEAYKASPEVTEKRLIIEALEAILPGAEITIIEGGGDTVKYLPIQTRREVNP
jgi:modulator of FtsH protease HflK